MVGIDIVEIARIAVAVEKFGDRFLKRVFADAELSYAMQKKKKVYESLAGRFAAKEAFMKAMGRRLPWREIEVRVGPKGRPYIVFREQRYDGLSISHERAYAVSAFVCGERTTTGESI